MNDEMAPAEIARALKRLEDSQTIQIAKLNDIIVQTTRTNGRVDTLEVQVQSIERDRGRREHVGRRSTDKGDAIAINVPINGKTITALLIALAALLAAAFNKLPGLG